MSFTRTSRIPSTKLIVKKYRYALLNVEVIKLRSYNLKRESINTILYSLQDKKNKGLKKKYHFQDFNILGV
jgi:hypothetical protein